jgi:septal ring factor EnvC (AmiA/AmiB activator)
MKYQIKLTELGLTFALVSARLKKNIQEIESTNESLNNAKTLANQGNEEAKADIPEIEASIEAMDSQLCIDLEKFHKNKDHYARLAANLRTKANEKAGVATSPQAATKVVAMTATPANQSAQPAQVINTNTQSAQTPTSQTPPPAAQPVKKKSNALYWVLGIAATAAGCWLGIKIVPPILNKK